MASYSGGITIDGGGFDDYEGDREEWLDGGGFDYDDADSDLERMRSFVGRFPKSEELAEFAIDYADRVPNTAGLFPGGLVEVRRSSDLLGNVTVENQYNFALYAVMEKAPGDDAGATYNAEWVAEFQRWVQEQSVTGAAPTFGDEPRHERMTAQNGAIYSADAEGVAVYAIQISAQFTRRYERG